MRITQSQLRRIIKEEIESLREDEFIPVGSSRFDGLTKMRDYAINFMKSEDPVLSDVGSILYYSANLGLTKVPSSSQARAGSADDFKNEIDQSIQSLMSRK